MKINIEKLREDLIDYYGTAMQNGFQMVALEISKIEKASAEELIKIAEKNKMNLKKYIIEEIER